MSSDVLRMGVDEAGLGPTLGPLGIASFATRGPADLRMALVGAVGELGAEAPMLEVGDSKKLFSGSRKLARLERTVLATWMWVHGSETLPSTARAFLDSVRGPETPPTAKWRAPWYAAGRRLDDPLPMAADPDQILETAALLSRMAKAAGVEACGYRASVLTASAINAGLAREVELGGSKNTWVVQRTLTLVRAELERRLDEAGALVLCDKAGGRADYLQSLARSFPAYAAEVLDVQRARSVYRLSGLLDDRPGFEIAFAMKADDFDPRVSWASCLAKYCRELCMHALNDWFGTQAPNLRPTAGYPEDAKRFIEEAAEVASAADLSAPMWIRSR